MTIQKTDFTPVEQTTIQGWIDTEIPARIAAYQESLLQLYASKAILQPIEDIFQKIYASWDTIHTSGFLREIQGLNGNFVDPPITESEILSTAQNPLGSRLFPAGHASLDPLYAYDLRALPSDLNGNQVAWTGTEGGGDFAATGYDEREALEREYVEWAKPAPPPVDSAHQNNAIIRDMWLAEEASLTTQIVALNLLNANLAATDPGLVNIAGSLIAAGAALSTVQGYIANYPGMPAEGARQTEISSRIAAIDIRVNEIIDPGTDQNQVRAERYYWIRTRLNLGFGSLSRLESTNNTIASINARIADLQAELLKYTGMGF